MFRLKNINFKRVGVFKRIMSFKRIISFMKNIKLKQVIKFEKIKNYLRITKLAASKLVATSRSFVIATLLLSVFAVSAPATSIFAASAEKTNAINNVGSATSIGVDWQKGTKISMSEGQRISSIAYSDRMFVVVGGNRMLYSQDDGSTWANVKLPVDASLISVTYGDGYGGLFVAVGNTNQHDSKPIIMTSSDGMNWKLTDLGANSSFNLTSVAYGKDTDSKGVFVATAVNFIDDSIEWSAMWSYDGIKWSTQKMTGLGDSSGVAVGYGDDVFVFVYNNANVISHYNNNVKVKTGSIVGQGFIISDIVRQVPVRSFGPLEVAYGGGMFVIAVLEGDSSLNTPAINYSKAPVTDVGWRVSKGATFSERAGYSALIYAEDVFVATKAGGSSVVISKDHGVSFNTHKVDAAVMPPGLWVSAYGNDIIMAVSATGDVMTSAGDATPPAPSVNAAN